MTLEIATLSRLKPAWGIAFLGGGSVWILSRPFWERGGLDALIAGQDAGRHWWPILAACAAILLSMMALYALKVVRHRGPAVEIRDGELRYFGGKPVLVAMISEVSIYKSGCLDPRPGAVVLMLEDGSQKQIHTTHLKEDVDTVAERIRTALDLPMPPTSPAPPLS